MNLQYKEFNEWVNKQLYPKAGALVRNKLKENNQ